MAGVNFRPDPSQQSLTDTSSKFTKLNAGPSSVELVELAWKLNVFRTH